MIYSAAPATIFRQINRNSFQRNTTEWWATLKTYFYPIYDKRRANVISKKASNKINFEVDDNDEDV